MGWTEEKLAQIREHQKAQEADMDWQVQKSAILARESRNLWDSLAMLVEVEAKKFKESEPAASDIRTYFKNPQANKRDCLVIKTIVKPILHLELTYDQKRQRVAGTVSACNVRVEENAIGPFFIDVLPNGITFIEGGRETTILQIASTVLDPIGNLFGFGSIFTPQSGLRSSRVGR